MRKISRVGEYANISLLQQIDTNMRHALRVVASSSESFPHHLDLARLIRFMMMTSLAPTHRRFSGSGLSYWHYFQSMNTINVSDPPVALKSVGKRFFIVNSAQPS